MLRHQHLRAEPGEQSQKKSPQQIFQKKDNKFSLRSSKADHFRINKMARSSAISSGDCRRRVAAITANTRCLRRACAIAARAESSSVEEVSIIIPRITTKPSGVSKSDSHERSYQDTIGWQTFRCLPSDPRP